jgi:hypothetical protein
MERYINLILYKMLEEEKIAKFVKKVMVSSIENTIVKDASGVLMIIAAKNKLLYFFYLNDKGH